MQGDLKARLMPLLLLAAYHPERSWEEIVVELLDTLSALPPSGGVNYVRVFLLYHLSLAVFHPEPKAWVGVKQVRLP